MSQNVTQHGGNSATRPVVSRVMFGTEWLLGIPDNPRNSRTAEDCDDFLWTLTMRTKQVIVDAGVFFKLCSLVLSTAATIHMIHMMVLHAYLWHILMVDFTDCFQVQQKTSCFWNVLFQYTDSNNFK